MPGSPPTSPVFGAPRFSDGDLASFSAQVNGITDILDAKAMPRWNYRVAGAGATAANDGDFLYAPGGSGGVTLGTPTAGRIVAVQANASVSSSSYVRVIGSVNSLICEGGAPNGQTEIDMNTPGAVLVFVADGAKWHVIGKLDWGWQMATPAAVQDGVSSPAATGTNPLSLRVLGNQVFFAGVSYSAAAIASGTTLFSIPFGTSPAKNIYLNAPAITAGGYSGAFQIPAGGFAAKAVGVFGGTAVLNSFEGLSYQVLAN
jgi:hypothetical protein